MYLFTSLPLPANKLFFQCGHNVKVNPPAPFFLLTPQLKGPTNSSSSDGTNHHSVPHGGPSNRLLSGDNGNRECAYCHKRNHIISLCSKLQAKRRQLPQYHSDIVPIDVGLVACRDVQTSSVISEPKSIVSHLEPFVSYCQAGYLIGQAGQGNIIVILRDTG